MVKLVLSKPGDGSMDPNAGNGATKVREPLWRHMLGEQLRTVRRDRGETLTEVANRAGVSPQYLSEIERGRKEPSSEMIAAIGGALDLTLVDLTSLVSERLVARQSHRPQAAHRGVFALAA